jgi:uncharacterized protein
MEHVPLFPLNTVLFPGARLPLKIFEQRYLTLIKDCLKQDAEFVVVLISKGQEVGITPEVFSVGTCARVVDWDQLEGGILSVTVEGRERVQINKASGAMGELLWAEAQPLEDVEQSQQPLDVELVSLLKKLEQHPLVQAKGTAIDYESLTSVMWGLANLLPIDQVQKQHLLELDDSQQRYNALHYMLSELEG